MPYKNIEARRAKNQRWRAANPGYYAEYRKRNKAKVDENYARCIAAQPEKNRARQKVNYRVVQRRSWPKASVFKCSDCNAQAAHYHHEDYALWWSVEPLCHKCHGVRHRK